MVYDIGDLMREIRVCLDRNMTSESLLSTDDIDTLAVDDIIKSKIEPAARIVETAAPRHLLDSGKAFAESIGWPGEVGIGCGIIHLPDDFMRLITFQMSDWERAVTDPAEEGSEAYNKQRSRYAGIRGTPQRPVVVISQQPIGQVLEFYSCRGGSNVKLLRARYLPYPKIKPSGQQGAIEICEKLKEAVIHYAGYMTALTLGATELAKSLEGMAKELMQ